MNQCERIRLHLLTKGSLTQLEATRFERPILRLSERIRELEEAGMHINHVEEVCTAQDGSKSRYMRYVYAGDEQLRMAI